MYRCELCSDVVPPKQPRRTHAILRQREPLRLPSGQVLSAPGTEIARELAVCPTCHRLLEAGLPLASVVRQRAQAVPPPPPLARSPLSPVPDPAVAHKPVALTAGMLRTRHGGLGIA